MKRYVEYGDITSKSADALIYSTNVRLMMTGGVGAALASKFGISVQIDLHNASAGNGRQMAEVSDVLSTAIPNSPWKVVFHTIATDELYRTEESTVRKILKSCLTKCAKRGDVRSIACSALGAGYGDLSPEDFISIATSITEEFRESGIEEFSVVESDKKQFDSLLLAAKTTERWSSSEAS